VLDALNLGPEPSLKTLTSDWLHSTNQLRLSLLSQYRIWDGIKCFSVLDSCLWIHFFKFRRNSISTFN